MELDGDHLTLSAPLTSSIVSDPAAFEQLQAEWDALLDDSAQDAFFLRWHWNWLWWQHFAPRRSTLHIVRCTDGSGRLAGIAPLYRLQHQIFGVSSARELAMLGTGIELKTSEYLDIVARRGAERAVSQSMGACLKAHGAWDRLWLHRVPEESKVIPHLLRELDGHVSSTVCDSAPYVDTSVSWDDYKRSLGRSMRRNVDYYARRLFKKYTCEFRLVESDGDLESAINDLVRLHQMRWRSAAEAGVFSSPEVESFLREAMRRSQLEGRLRLWTLSLNGTVEAALVGFLDNGVLHYFQKGFNPEYAADDLGTAMLSLCIRASFDDPRVQSFDFMSGGAVYKRLWARHERVTVLHEVSRPNLRARCYTGLRQIREVANATLRVVTPAWMRDARRGWLRRRRVRRLVRLRSTLWAASSLLSGPLAEWCLTVPSLQQ